MKIKRLLEIGCLLESRAEATALNKIAAKVRKQLLEGIQNGAESWVADSLRALMKDMKRDLKAAGDPSGEYVEDVVLVNIAKDASKAFRDGLVKALGGLGDR